jgi:hypothetical protein
MMKRIAMIALPMLLLGALATAAAAGSPSARISPHGHLTDGETVTVSWRGLRGLSHRVAGLGIAQCTADLPTAPLTGSNINTFCDVDTQWSTDDPTPKGSGPLTVVAGAIGTSGETCGTSSQDRKNCEVLVYEVGNGEVRATPYAVAPIAFQAPPAGAFAQEH